jgi:hypothetical protein
MDALIAEKVMGLPCVDDPPGSGRDCPQHGCPAYSTGTAAAWLVVEEMARRGFHARINTPFTPGAPYFAGFTPHATTGWNGRPDHEGSGQAAPLAICRAALVAVEAE